MQAVCNSLYFEVALCPAEWIDFPRDDIYDTSTGKFVPGEDAMLKDDCQSLS